MTKLNNRKLAKRKVSLAASYKLYLAAGPKPKNRFSNPRNLFNDLNVIDRLLFRQALTYSRWLSSGVIQK